MVLKFFLHSKIYVQQSFLGTTIPFYHPRVYKLKEIVKNEGLKYPTFKKKIFKLLEIKIKRGEKRIR